MRGLQRLCTGVRQAASVTGLQQLAVPSLQRAVPWGQAAALPSCALQARSCPPCIASSRGFSGSSFAAQPTQEQGSVEGAQLNPLSFAPDTSSMSPLKDAPGGAPGQEPVARAVLRKTHISPQKLNDFARLLRRLHVEDALIQCEVSPKKAARICRKLLLSAQANAQNNHGMDVDKLRIDKMFVGHGHHEKRPALHGRGKTGTIRKPRSHLTVLLTEGSTKRITKIEPPMMLRHRKHFEEQSMIRG